MGNLSHGRPRPAVFRSSSLNKHNNVQASLNEEAGDLHDKEASDSKYMSGKNIG